MDEQSEQKLRDLVMLALGRAALAWNPVPDSAFNDESAISIGEQLIKAILSLVPAPPPPAP